MMRFEEWQKFERAYSALAVDLDAAIAAMDAEGITEAGAALDALLATEEARVAKDYFGSADYARRLTEAARRIAAERRIVVTYRIEADADRKRRGEPTFPVDVLLAAHAALVNE